jgi:hypothetical protein
VMMPAIVGSVVMTACVMAGAMVMAMMAAMVGRLCLSSQRHEQRGCDCGNECETSQQVFHSYLHRFLGVCGYIQTASRSRRRSNGKTPDCLTGL